MLSYIQRNAECEINIAISESEVWRTADAVRMALVEELGLSRSMLIGETMWTQTCDPIR